MKKYARLFEFLYELIDIQIKKYVKLMQNGAGPDAGMNAHLVCREVNELLNFAAELLTAIETQNPDQYQFEYIFNQIKFYCEEEYLRGYAAWLIHENSIHNPLFERVKEQNIELEEIANFAGITSFNSKAKAITDVQKQLEYDSHAIAFLILDLVIKLKENPNMPFDESMPRHGIDIIRAQIKNSNSRYYYPAISNAISSLHDDCLTFLTHSNLEKSSITLSKQAVFEAEKQDRQLLKNYLARFQAIYPKSVLFSTDHQLYNIGQTLPAQPQRYNLFTNSLCIATAIALLLYVVLQTDCLKKMGLTY